jgi:dTDP-4-dehydrorhamnose reductase
MLGHVVARYFAQYGLEVITSELRYVGAPRDPLVEAVRDSGCEWIVNALGRIKQKSQQPPELFLANTVLPHHLRMRLRSNQRMVHASTDCVFSGKEGNYTLVSPCDAADHYGLSKALAEAVAEPGRCWVIRTSIIGPELGTAKGLLAWFLSQMGEIEGFTNHFWNGITTLEWAKVCLDIVQSDPQLHGPLIQPGTCPSLSKCELLELFRKIWGRNVVIRPTPAEQELNRTLQPTIIRPPLEEQLRELKAWYSSANALCSTK